MPRSATIWGQNAPRRRILLENAGFANGAGATRGRGRQIMTVDAPKTRPPSFFGGLSLVRARGRREPSTDPPHSTPHRLLVAERSKTNPNQCKTAQNDTKSLQNAAKRPQSNAERGKRPQINAGRTKTTPSRCRTQPNDPKLLQNAHSLENELIL